MAVVAMLCAAMAHAQHVDPVDMTNNRVSDRAQKLIAQSCAGCHGARGVSNDSTVPHLAAQQKLYLASQMRAFKQRERGSPQSHEVMWTLAAELDDATIQQLADFFSRQPAAPGAAGSADDIAEGRALYVKRPADRAVPACADCHGKAAHGGGVFPRLAGQHADYLASQFEAVRDWSRESALMHNVVAQFSRDEARALAVYLQSLK
jgi:cytochrome c553